MRNISSATIAKKFGRLILGLALIAGGRSIQAQSFSYNTGDLILAFRQSGQPDLEVNIGQASIYDAAPSGTTINITNTPTVASLLNLYPTLDGLSWSVTGSERASTNLTYPIQTVWVTSPRSVVGTPANAWLRQSSASQGNYASIIAAIGNNGATYGSIQPASAISNNVTTLIIPANSTYAYTPEVSNPANSAASDLHGTFQGNVENITPADFDSTSPLSRSDLYEIIPSTNSATRNTPAKLVGSFNFTPDGKVTFTAGSVVSTPPPAPTITAIKRSGSVTTVSFTTAATYHYSLSFTNTYGLAAPVSSWGSTGTAAGDGSVQSLQHTTTASNIFYKVRAY